MAGASEVSICAQLGGHARINTVTLDIVVPTKAAQIVPSLTSGHGKGSTFAVEAMVELASSTLVWRFWVLFCVKATDNGVAFLAVCFWCDTMNLHDFHALHSTLHSKEKPNQRTRGQWLLRTTWCWFVSFWPIESAFRLKL